MPAVGILPVGALGVSFFYHLTRELRQLDGRVRFLERRGSERGRALREHGSLLIADDHATRSISTAEICQPDLRTSAQAGWLPEIVLVCTQPDQLLPVITDYVGLFEDLHAVHGLDEAIARLPLLVLCSNGIYHERVRRFLVESVEDSMLYGRLPDLWSDAMGRVVVKLLRGVTIQTGHREQSGAEAIYRPGPAARTTLAGGDPAHRRRCASTLQSLGARFESADTAPPVRVEFDKALINLWGNLLGQLKAIDEQGNFRPLTVREIHPQPESPETRELAHHLIAVGRAVRAYREDEDFETIYHSAMTAARGPLDHVPSSLRLIESQLRHGTLRPQLAATEAWLLDPLLRFARGAGLDDTVNYFTTLRERIEHRLAAAASRLSARSRTIVPARSA